MESWHYIIYRQQLLESQYHWCIHFMHALLYQAKKAPPKAEILLQEAF
jgi:hypothetical protein